MLHNGTTRRALRLVAATAFVAAAVVTIAGCSALPGTRATSTSTSTHSSTSDGSHAATDSAAAGSSGSSSATAGGDATDSGPTPDAVLTVGASGGGSASASVAPANVVRSASQIQKATPATLYGGGAYVQAASQAGTVAAALAHQGKSAEAALIRQISSQPVAIWLGEWYSNAQLTSLIASTTAAAEKAGTTPVFVTYAIPDRDCGGYSAGGLTSTEYLAWNQRIATELRGHRSVVLVEPDSLAMLSTCPAEASTRLPLIKSAVQTLVAAGVTTYLDAGDSNWVAPDVMAARLTAAGVASARGFFTNVSNFYPTAVENSYAARVSADLGGSHYVIDTSRNGQGWKGTWCNPTGAGLGANPAVTNGSTGLDATLWVKTPGASDGTCNGGPSAGTWWEDYALALVRLRAN